MPYVPTERSNVETVDQLRAWVQEELRAISREMQETTALELRPVFREPEKARDGMIVYADGTEWDPGSGEGIYGYENGAWIKL